MSRRVKRGSPARRFSTQEQSDDLNEILAFGSTYPRPPGMSVSVVSIAPSSMRIALTYVSNTSMTSTTGSLASYIYSGNGVFDPDITGTGAQPMGFDQWSTLYQRYRVLASAIDVSFSVPSSTTNATGTFDVALVPSNSASTFSSFNAAAGSPYAKARFFNGNGAPSLRFKSKMDTATMYGVPRAAVLSDDTLQALTSANPSNQYYWHICATTADLTSTSTIQSVARITYLVDFFERTLLSVSLFESAKTRMEAWEAYCAYKKARRLSLKQ